MQAKAVSLASTIVSVTHDKERAASTGVRTSCRLAADSASARPSKVPTRSQVHGVSHPFGSRSKVLTATINASAAKQTDSFTVGVNFSAIAARNTHSASKPNWAKKPTRPHAPIVMIQYPSVMVLSAPFQP